MSSAAHAAGAAGGDGLSRREVVPGEALVGGDGEPGVLDGALGDDPTSGGIGVGDGEGGVEPLAGCAAGAAELRRDEDVEQPLGHHALEGRPRRGWLAASAAAASARIMSSSWGEGKGAALGVVLVDDAGTGEVGGQVHASSSGSVRVMAGGPTQCTARGASVSG